MPISLNILGLNLVLILMMLLLVHKEVVSLLPFYREIFAIFFILLILKQKKLDISQFILNRKFFLVNVSLIIFPLLIIILGFIDPMVSLYPDTLKKATDFGGDINPKFYIFRNAVIYLPMLFYISIRGLSTKDINKIASVIAFFAPISICTYLFNLGYPNPPFSVNGFVSGDLELEYNTFVPCFSLSVLSIIYLLDVKVFSYSKFIKIVLITILVFILFFIFFSTSRQALLLCFIYILIFFFRIFSFRWLRNSIFYLIAIASLIYLYQWSISNFGENIRLFYRLTDFETTTSRIEIMLAGIKKLEGFQFFTGAGLTSVLVSGPHNDYIRWTQRIGLIFMFISFYPFFSAMLRSFFDISINKKYKVYLYIFCINLFVLYNSFFGYPREDAYQSIFCFLGIAIWLGHLNYNRMKKIKMQESSTFK